MESIKNALEAICRCGFYSMNIWISLNDVLLSFSAKNICTFRRLWWASVGVKFIVDALLYVYALFLAAQQQKRWTLINKPYTNGNICTDEKKCTPPQIHYPSFDLIYHVVWMFNTNEVASKQ